MQGRKDEVHMEKLRMQLEQVAKKVTLAINERYIRPTLRKCGNRECLLPNETRPDQYHRWLSGGTLRFCSSECHSAFEHYANTNNFLGYDSLCSGGPLSDNLVMRCLLFLPERPFWFRIARTCRRNWKLVSQHRSSVRFPGVITPNPLAKSKMPQLGFKSVDPMVMMKLLERSPSLLHLDFGDCTVVDDKVIWQIGKSCPNLLTLSLRGCPSITDFALEDLAACVLLERLDLSFCSHISDEGLLGLSNALSNLRLLSLAHCPDVTEAGIEAVAAGCRRLMYVDISFCKRISDRGLKALIRNCSELRYLNVRGASNLSTAQLERAQKQIPEVVGLSWQEIVPADPTAKGFD
mmetsp:Transcript_54649/g.124901  ORF Transcript_54649/g.124901 Transcript_54649/m.124901 type:complete len:350 (-) Transcript_54649:58-1107(-)